MPDRYTYPGSDVLINKYGITDYDGWKEVETDFIGARMGYLREHPLPGGYDLAHLQANHAYLTQDMYAWGGVWELSRQMHHSPVPHERSEARIAEMTPA